MTTLQMLLTFAGFIVTGLATFSAARYTSRSSVKVKEIDVDAAAYERAEKINAAAFGRLERRIEELESRDETRSKEFEKIRVGFDKLTRVFRIAINFIEQFLLWERDGSTPPRPNIPKDLKEYLDPSLIREHVRQQEEDQIV